MPRFAESSKNKTTTPQKPHPQQKSVRQTFFEWVYTQQQTSGTRTPVNTDKKRLNQLTRPLRETLAKAVGEDDALVNMYDLHTEFIVLHMNALAFVDTSSTGHKTCLQNMYTAVMNGTVVDDAARANCMTTVHFEAMKAIITETLTNTLKRRHSAFNQHERYLHLIEAIFGDGKSHDDATLCVTPRAPNAVRFALFHLTPCPHTLPSWTVSQMVQ